MNVTIGTPMYGGQCHGSFMTSVFELNKILSENGHSMNMEFIYNESLIQRARNNISNKFFNDDESDVLLFIDSDIHFNAADIYNMLTMDYDIIGAVVPLKSNHFENIRLASLLGKKAIDLPYFGGYFNINCKHDDIVDDVLNNRPFKVDRIGTAMLSIKKGVLKEMSKFAEHYSQGNNAGDGSLLIYDFFPVKIEENRLMSEDYMFCNNARKIGYDIYATAYPLISHIGTQIFSGNLMYEMNLIKEYNELQERNKE